MKGSEYEALAWRFVPRGVKVVYSDHRKRSLSGLSDFEANTIRCGRPTCLETFYVFIHECAHFMLGHDTLEVSLHEQEYQAERLAFEIMRQNGLRVPKRLVIEAKLYVAACIARDRIDGVKILKRVERWAALSCRERANMPSTVGDHSTVSSTKRSTGRKAR